jgi:hypothetical protein
MLPAFLNLGAPEIILIILVLCFPLMIVLPVIAIVKAGSNVSLSKTDKLLWMLLIVFVPVLGSILYLALANNKTVNVGQ